MKETELEKKLYSFYGYRFAPKMDPGKDIIPGLPEARDKNGDLAAPFVLAWLLTAHEAENEAKASRRESIKTDYPKPGVRPEAEKILALLDPASLQKALLKLSAALQPRWGTFSKQWFLAYPLCRYADERTMAELCRLAEHLCSKTNGDDAPGAWIFRQAAVYSNTRAAMLYADKHGDLERYAMLRGTTAEILRDTVLSEFGLNEQGEKEYDLGSGKLTVTLNSELKLEMFDHAAGKVVKSVPKKKADPEKYEAAKADIDDMKKNIRKVIKHRTDLLFDAFLDKQRFDAETWQAVYTKNPVLNAVARLLVWEQGGVCFTLEGKETIDSTGQAYQLTDAPVYVAHPMSMDPAEITAWQQYFTARNLKQPFAQVWEPVVDRKSVTEDRYRGSTLPLFVFRGRKKHGIHVDGGSFFGDPVSIRFAGCDADVEPADGQQSSNFNEKRYEIKSLRFRWYSRQVNHIVVYLDKVAVDACIRRDDTAIADRLDEFTLAQIMNFIKIAQEANAVNVLALLLEYKNAHFADFDPMDEFTLEW